MTISPDGHEPTVFDIEIRVDSRMPAVVEAPIEGAQLGSTVDAVLRPPEGFSIPGPVTWRMTATDQAFQSPAAPDPAWDDHRTGHEWDSTCITRCRRARKKNTKY